MTTNGLVGTHFIPAAHDHGMPQTTAAGLLALVGLFDIVGTIASGWLTDRIDSRLLLGAYYGLRGLSLLVLPSLFADSAQPSMLVFIIFYGLDWVATVPPTVALCREYFGASGSGGVRLGVRRPPDRRGGGGQRRRPDPRSARYVRVGLVSGRGALRRRGRTLPAVASPGRPTGPARGDPAGRFRGDPAGRFRGAPVGRPGRFSAGGGYRVRHC